MAEQRQKGKSPAPMMITGLVMVLLFCGLVFFLVSQGQSIPNVEEVKAEGRLKNLADLNSENQKVLTQYRWVDKSKGVVGVPIDRAMELVVAELQSNKPHPAGPVAPPAAPPPAASPPAASPPAAQTPAPNNQKPAGQP
jgi:hypothetical protein